MDWNQVEGNWKQVKGKIKEQWASSLTMISTLSPVSAISSRAKSKSSTDTQRIGPKRKSTIGTIGRHGDVGPRYGRYRDLDASVRG
jgi:hypothetical protein